MQDFQIHSKTGSVTTNPHCQLPFGRMVLRCIDVEHVSLLQSLLSWGISPSCLTEDCRGELLVRISMRSWHVCPSWSLVTISDYRECQKIQVLWSLKLIWYRIWLHYTFYINFTNCVNYLSIWIHY